MVRSLPAMQRSRFDPWVGKIPWRREWLPNPILLPGEFHGQRSLAGYRDGNSGKGTDLGGSCKVWGAHEASRWWYLTCSRIEVSKHSEKRPWGGGVVKPATTVPCTVSTTLQGLHIHCLRSYTRCMAPCFIIADCPLTWGQPSAFRDHLSWKASKSGKLSSGHRTEKGQFSFQYQRKAMPKNVQTITQLHLSHMLASEKWKSLSRVRLFVTPWTIQSMEFFRPEYWSG